MTESMKHIPPWRLVYCPTCEAGPAMVCVSIDGGKMRRVHAHKARRQLYERWKKNQRGRR